MEKPACEVLREKIGRIKGSNVDPAWLAGELRAAKIIGAADFQRASNAREEEDERLGKLVGKVMRNGAPDVFQTFVSILLKEDHIKWLGKELKGEASSHTFYQPSFSIELLEKIAHFCSRLHYKGRCLEERAYLTTASWTPRLVLEYTLRNGIGYSSRDLIERVTAGT